MAKGKKRKVAPGDVATNRYASYRYDLTDRLECGVVLAGTEVKSLRSGTAQIKDGYAQVRDGELWLHNVHIPPYGPASRENHDPDRPRKLLAHRREIERMVAQDPGARADPRADAHLLLRARGPRSRSRSAAARTASTSASR